MHPDEKNLLKAIESADLKTVIKLASSSNIRREMLRDDLQNPILCLALKKVDESKPDTIEIANKLIIKDYPVNLADKNC